MGGKVEISASDTAFLLDALQHVASPIIVCQGASAIGSPSETDPSQINAGEIAVKKDAKVNTIMKRFSEIKRRYNLNIQTTAVGYHPPKRVAVNKVVKKLGGRPVKSKAGVAAPAGPKTTRKQPEDEVAAFNFEQFVHAETL